MSRNNERINHFVQEFFESANRMDYSERIEAIDSLRKDATNAQTISVRNLLWLISNVVEDSGDGPIAMIFTLTIPKRKK